MKKNHDKPGENAEYGGEACAGMEWCEPKGSRTADAEEKHRKMTIS